jgi:hypothetical protein
MEIARILESEEMRSRGKGATQTKGFRVRFCRDWRVSCGLSRRNFFYSLIYRVEFRAS